MIKKKKKTRRTKSSRKKKKKQKEFSELLVSFSLFPIVFLS